VSYFLKQGNRFIQTDKANLDIKETLPGGTYALKYEMPGPGFFYERIDDFTIPQKKYGDVLKNTSRIIQTFENRESATGILLAGEKGSGKTLLAKNLSYELIKCGLPTIVINTSFVGESFNTFIQQLDQPAVILFDEFEKIYDEEEQEKLLTLFDGVYPSKKLFILTTNNEWKIDKHMRNRPGRIYYMLSFKGLTADFVEEYAQENLKNQSNLGSVMTLSSLFETFNFDMLKALIEEMNRYDEPAHESIQMLNAKPEGNKAQFDVVDLIVPGLKVQGYKITWHGSPLSDNIRLGYHYPRVTAKAKAPTPALDDFVNFDDDDNLAYGDVEFNASNLVTIDAVEGVYVYEKDGTKLTLNRKKVTIYDYSKLFD
jgi:hypothetical protein